MCTEIRWNQSWRQQDKSGLISLSYLLMTMDGHSNMEDIRNTMKIIEIRQDATH